MPHSDRCSNPYNKRRHIGKGLRNISKSLLQNFPHLSKNSKICHDCRNKIGNDPRDNNISFNERHNDCDGSVEIDDNMSLANDNTGESFETTKQFRSSREIELEELFSGLKEKFSSLEKNDPMKLRILSIAPESWSIRKICDEFGMSRHMAAKAKALRSAGEVLAETTARAGRT